MTDSIISRGKINQDKSIHKEIMVKIYLFQILRIFKFLFDQNTTSQWKLIGNCLPRKEATQQVYTREVKAVAEELKSFLYLLALKHQRHSGQYIPDEEKFNFRAVSSHEIRRAVMSFSSNKAPGFDKVTMSVIKDALPCILPVLTDIVNRSLLYVSFSCSVENI